ncbi:ABC transporter substrate-binding protein [Tsukamurella sp. 8F]|uniref:ABC transporter substrate-binding protein n=1 Tax=unclassified Tsukamurella TaxID=2633480 RepID=UPI0023B97D4E|nr:MULTISPECIES: ABC transporter substrate-binding protein [unclassified Tsukamurella]MDF0528447.1 ABC transporter substrate-binding protein [Tsukamurella sp. 8J]MDF0586272.1 ABC transporter substrate-binding protein [Tsukamurella sp. 8F]
MADLNRRAFLGLAAAATASLAAACAGTGSSGGGSGSGGSGGASGGPITLQFWSNHPGTSKSIEQKLIDAFQQANPNIKVNLVDGGKDYEELSQKFTTSLTGGSLPDIIVASDVTWFPFALNKQIEPLDDHFAAAGTDTSDYVDSLLGDYLFEGKHYAIPYARSTPLFYYNRDVWKKAGLEDRGPKDWAEFASWEPKLTEAIGGGKKAIVLPDATDYLEWHFEGWNWSMGGAYSDGWDLKFTDPNTVKAAQLLQQVAKSSGRLATNPLNDFSAGTAAALLESTGSLKTITQQAKFEVGTAFLPGPQGKSCPTGGAGLAIPSGISTERKVAALKFITFLTNSANTSAFSQGTGYMPVRKSAVDDASMKAFIEKNPNFGTAVKQLPFTKSQDNARVFVPGGARDIGQALQQIANGSDPASTLATLQKTIQGKIDSQIKPKLPK